MNLINAANEMHARKERITFDKIANETGIIHSINCLIKTMLISMNVN